MEFSDGIFLCGLCFVAVIFLRISIAPHDKMGYTIIRDFKTITLRKGGTFNAQEIYAKEL